ncbi:MAG: hypothetical protein ACW981_12185 [Candidatus Hodarchaeales archaeon]|jgi:hypothetical protein
MNHQKKLNFKRKCLLGINLAIIIYLLIYSVLVQGFTVIIIDGKPYTDYQPPPSFFPIPRLLWDSIRCKCLFPLSPIDELIYMVVIATNIYILLLISSLGLFFYFLRKFIYKK